MKALCALIPFLLASCGTTRGERLQLYGAAAQIAGHPEIGVPLAAIGRRLDAKQPREKITP